MGKFTKGTKVAAKLTPTEVYELRQKYVKGATQGALAREYGVTVGTIGRIVRGETWQEYPDPGQIIKNNYLDDPTMPIVPPPSEENIAASEARMKKFLKDIEIQKQAEALPETLLKELDK